MMIRNYDELMSSGRISYEVINELIAPKMLLEIPVYGLSLKNIMMTLDVSIQLILLNVAACDGYILKQEIEYIKMFRNYVDIMSASGFSWDLLMTFTGKELKKIIEKINNSVFSTSDRIISEIKEVDPEVLFSFEAEISNICQCLACIDGDNSESYDYSKEMSAGMEVFKKLFYTDDSYENSLFNS